MANYIYKQVGDYLESADIKNSSQLGGVTERPGSWN